MIPYLITEYQKTLTEIGLYKYLQVFNQITFRATFAIILAMLMVWVLGPRVIRWLIKQKIGDTTNFDHADLDRLTSDKRNTPTMGGILISGTIFTISFLLADITKFYVTMGLICLFCYTAIGAVDDWLKLTSARRSGGRQGLMSWEKLLFQVGFALLFGFFIYYHGLNNETTRLMALPFQRVIDRQSSRICGYQLWDMVGYWIRGCRSSLGPRSKSAWVTGFAPFRPARGITCGERALLVTNSMV